MKKMGPIYYITQLVLWTIPESDRGQIEGRSNATDINK